MRIGIVRTSGSPCRCAESISEGLTALKHESLVVDSGEIEIHASTLARECDLVIDHTDTYCGRGLLRPLVRLMLETYEARVLGSPASACLLADNKAAAKGVLADSGIPVPPGIVINSPEWQLPKWLKPPFVLKPASEHMSRGVTHVRTDQEAYSAAEQLLRSLRQPILLESFIPGRELAVSLVDGPDGLQVLPVLEWGMADTGTGILTEGFKLMDPLDERHRILRPDLPEAISQELHDLAIHAFHTLRLRDYARFDIRLSLEGTAYFLEANTTPSLEPLEALAVSAQWAGLDYPALIERLISAALRRDARSSQTKARPRHIQLSRDTIELESIEEVSPPAESTIELARLLDISPGERVFEPGCGSGLLSIAAAKLGASHVVASDLNASALRASVLNAGLNQVEDLIEFRAGSWYEVLQPTELVDVIIATPPQTPGRIALGAKYGGFDGTRHLLKVIRSAPRFLRPEHGRLWLLVISIANVSEVQKALHDCFADVRLVHKTRRTFTAAEYDALAPELFDYLCSLRQSGVSSFAEMNEGEYFFENLFIRAAGPKKTSI